MDLLSSTGLGTCIIIVLGVCGGMLATWWDDRQDGADQ